ncbi:suppressor APC domain-containing protein 2 isoform X2 [Heterocephalus glaber]|uniref:Suppressor APC domain-containing protein 2 isoform X2 n=1 Tax=Heterocephalus glaber TaxID=10181 RepID=A0AAX6T5Z1_HETGA|nr:suppressor APC domain-containing protein 2 isoform X2 [Heterocephalus glaber]
MTPLLGSIPPVTCRSQARLWLHLSQANPAQTRSNAGLSDSWCLGCQIRSPKTTSRFSVRLPRMNESSRGPGFSSCGPVSLLVHSLAHSPSSAMTVRLPLQLCWPCSTGWDINVLGLLGARTDAPLGPAPCHPPLQAGPWGVASGPPAPPCTRLCPHSNLPAHLSASTQQPLSPQDVGMGGAVACRAPEVGVGDARRAPRARAERRRHTITNGVDCGLLKQVKELEQEQELLLQGLEMMARGRDWYQQQLQRVQEHQHQLGQSRAGADFGTAGGPRPLGRLLPKVQEVARCLGELLAAACACAAPGPAPASSSPPSWQQQTILMLKEQNRLLTQEVTDKSERITQLEQEKSALIKQLFEARALSQQEAGPLDSTFI